MPEVDEELLLPGGGEVGFVFGELLNGLADPRVCGSGGNGLATVVYNNDLGCVARELD